MDIQRPASVARKKKLRRISFAIAAVLVIGLVSVVLARLKPAAPTVERATVWPDKVRRGSMIVDVRGLGTLVPLDEARRWVPAATQARVEKIVLRPGAVVTPETVVLELTSLDRVHGFNLPEFKIRKDVAPKEITRVMLTPDKAGTFSFRCDVFCGDGHEDMTGTLVVDPD